MNILFDIIQTIDYDILFEISRNMRGGISDRIWMLISVLGNHGVVWISLAIILLLFRNTRRAGGGMLLALLLGFLIGNVLIKNLVMRPRPFVTYPNLTALLDPGDQWSFPSAHTLTAFAAATALAVFRPKSSILAFILAALIAFSRLYACVHYPSDVIAGALLGVICGLVAGWLADRLADGLHSIQLRKG